MAVEFISGKDHYDKVVARMASVRNRYGLVQPTLKTFTSKLAIHLSHSLLFLPNFSNEV